MSESNLYPNLEKENEEVKTSVEKTGVRVITVAELDELSEGKLSKSRADEIKNKVAELKKTLAHYKKIKRHWKRAHRVLHGVGVGLGVAIGGGAAALAVVASEGFAIPLAVPIGLGVAGAVETAVSEGIAIGLIKKKVHKFSEKLKIVSDCVNRMYMLYHRAIEDKKITIDEMQEFHDLVKEYEDEIAIHSDKHTNDDNLHLEKLKHQAELEVRKEEEAELLKKLKDEKREEIKKKYFRE